MIFKVILENSDMEDVIECMGLLEFEDGEGNRRPCTLVFSDPTTEKEEVEFSDLAGQIRNVKLFISGEEVPNNLFVGYRKCRIIVKQLNSFKGTPKETSDLPNVRLQDYLSPATDAEISQASDAPFTEEELQYARDRQRDGMNDYDVGTIIQLRQSYT